MSPARPPEVVSESSLEANVEVNVEKPGKGMAKVSLRVPKDEFTSEYRRGLRQAGGSIRMKGFRPGKVPLQVIEKQVGGDVRQQVIEHYIRRAYQQAVEQEELSPMAHPRVNLEGLTDELEGDFELDFEMPLRPEFELPDYRGLKVTSELEPVLPEEVEGALTDVKRQQSKPEPAGDEGIDEDGFVVCNVEFADGETTYFERENLRLAAHTPPPGLDAEAFKEALIGSKADDVLELEMTLPDFIEDEEARGKAATCKLTVSEAFRMTPPSEEELFGLLEVESAEQLQAKVTEQLTQVKAEREQQRIESALLDQILGGADIELPDSVIHDQTQSRLQQLHKRMEDAGAEHEEIHKAMEEQEATAREEATKGLSAMLLVQAIGKAEELLVTADEIDAEFEQIAARNESTVAEVREYYEKNDIGHQMALEILERKVREFLRENAVIEEPA